MSLLFFITLVILMTKSQALVKCNGTVTKLQLCTFEANYNMGNTGSTKLGHPLSLKSILSVLDVTEFDENESMITVILLFTVNWSDARIKLESNKPNKYVFCIKYLVELQFM